MAGIGAFFGGLAGGYAAGQKMQIERDEAEGRKKLRDQQIAEGQRKIDDAKSADETWQQLADIVSPRAQQPGITPDTDPTPNLDQGGLMPDGPRTPQDRIGMALYQNPSALFGNPEKLNAAAGLFLRSKDEKTREMGVRWLEAGYKANKENLIQAVQYASNGDLASAEKAYNATGDHKVVPGSLKWADDSKTTLTGVNAADGKPFEVKPQELLKSFLSPTEFFKVADAQKERVQKDRELGMREREVAAKETQAKAESDYREHYGKYLDAHSRYFEAQARKADGAAGAGKMNDKEVNRVIQAGGLAFRKQIESEMSKEDSKFNVNGMVNLLPEMQSELGSQIRNGTPPEAAYEHTYYKFKDRVNGLADALAPIITEANKPWTDSGKKEALAASLNKFMQDTGVSADAIKRYMPATKIGKADQDRVRAVLDTAGRTSSGKVQGSAEPAKKNFSNLWGG